MYPVVNLFTFLDYYVRPLGDENYQRKIWLSPSSFTDYDEATGLFQEQVENLTKSYCDQEGMNEYILLALKKLSDRIDKFDDNVTVDIPEGRDDLIISHPEWQSIRKLARETYDMAIEDLRKRGYAKT